MSAFKSRSPLNFVGDKSRRMTPYQGRRKAFGLFECPKCKNEWASAHSWANTYQVCRKCDEKVYPHKQSQLEIQVRDEEIEDPFGLEETFTGNPEHRQELCGKCKKRGRPCYQGH